ncbi:MAG: translocation/assembly module TamB domain-containing protein, partial [Polyangiaceae bacterium]
TVVDFDAQANVLWSDALRMGPSPDLPWNASAHVVLDELPLQTLQPLADRSVKGNVSGEVSVVDFHKDAHASVQLVFDSLKVGKAKYTNGYVRAGLATDGTMTALVRIDQIDGYAEATLAGGATWGAAMVPKVDGSKQVVASLDAKNVSAGVAQPFLDDYLNELDGRVDAQAKATIPPAGAPQVQGNIALRQGLVQSPILGEEFHDVTAKVALTPSGGDTLATANEIVAYGTTGKITAKATARLHGVQFAGANLVADLGAKNAPLQLTAEGQDYGEGYGNTTVSITKPQPNATDIKIAIPSFHVTVPQVSTRGLQDLTPAENIRVGVQNAGGAFMPLALGAKEELSVPSNTRIDIDVQMGKDCDVRVGDTVRVQLEGGPHLAVTDTSVVTGQIRLRGGTLDVQGKQFDIQDGGTITFNGGDPGNPDVAITAEWDAPDGTHVFADFNGPLKTGKVALRSEPPKSEIDLLAMIIFG